MATPEPLVVVHLANDSAHWANGVWGLVGAILGAAAAEYFGGQARKREIARQTKAAAFTTYHKLNHIYSDSLQFRDRVAEARAVMFQKAKAFESERDNLAQRGRQVGYVHHLPMFCEPYAGLAKTPAFTSEELVALTRLGAPELLNTIGILDRRFNGVVDAWERYGSEREQVNAVLREKLKLVRMDGTVASFEGSPEVERLVAAPMARLTGLLESIFTLSDELARDTLEALTLLVQAPTHPLGPKATITFQDPDGNQRTICAMDSRSARDAAPSANVRTK